MMPRENMCVRGLRAVCVTETMWTRSANKPCQFNKMAHDLCLWIHGEFNTYHTPKHGLCDTVSS